MSSEAVGYIAGAVGLHAAADKTISTRYLTGNVGFALSRSHDADCYLMQNVGFPTVKKPDTASYVGLNQLSDIDAHMARQIQRWADSPTPGRWGTLLGIPPVVVNLWVASGYFTGQLVRTSPDGVTWTAGTTPVDGLSPPRFSFCVAYNGSYWVMGSNDGLLRSTDGTTWIQVSSPFDALGTLTGYVVGLGWNGSLWVAVGHTTGGQGITATSTDGTTWTARTSFNSVGGANAEGDCVGWNGSLWVAGGQGWDGFNTPAIMTSPDGVTWTAQSTPIDTPGNSGTSGHVFGIAYNGSLFVAVCRSNSGTAVMTSPDGTTWTAHTSPMDGGNGNGVAWGGSKWVAVGHNAAGNGVVMTSPDGTTWTQQTSPFDGFFGTVNGIAWNGSLWVAGNQDGSTTKIATSPDGVTWTARDANSSGTTLVWGVASKPKTILA